MVKNSFRLIQQLQLFLAHPTPPRNIQLVDFVNENVCLKIYFTLGTHFMNHCMYNKYMCSFICKSQKCLCLEQSCFLASLGFFFFVNLLLFSNSNPVNSFMPFRRSFLTLIVVLKCLFVVFSCLCVIIFSPFMFYFFLFLECVIDCLK